MPRIILAAHGRITTRFREDIGRGFPHNGIDQGHGDGTPYDLQILAPADGVIVATGRQGSYGKRYVIRHDDGWRSILAHHATQHCSPGQRVTQGQIIAVMGNTGTVFVHSHQELLNDKGQQVDPLMHLSTTAGKGSPIQLEGEEEMPVTDADAQVLAKTQIILDPRWGQASLAETIAATRARSEDILTGVNLLTQIVAAQATGHGVSAEQLQIMINGALQESRVRIVADVEAALTDDFSNILRKITDGRLAELPGDALSAIAEAVNDENDRRERVRLGIRADTNDNR